MAPLSSTYTLYEFPVSKLESAGAGNLNMPTRSHGVNATIVVPSHLRGVSAKTPSVRLKLGRVLTLMCAMFFTYIYTYLWQSIINKLGLQRD